MSQKTCGGRFSGETDRRVEAFTESISFDRRLYAHDIVASQAHAAMLAEVGITLEFEVAGEDLAERLYFNRDGGGVVGPWSGRPDPAQTIANTDGPGFVNIAKTEVPEINELLAQANAAVDPAERAELFHQIDTLSAESHTSGIALFSPKTVFAYDSDVSGLPIYVQGKHEQKDRSRTHGRHLSFGRTSKYL